MKAVSVKILTHIDEDENEWVNLKPYIGKTGKVKEEALTYFLLTMDDNAEIFAPKECVTVRGALVKLNKQYPLTANPEE